MKIIKVKTDSKIYDIKVGHDLLGSTPLKKLVSQKDVLLIVDKKVPELLINQVPLLINQYLKKVDHLQNHQKFLKENSQLKIIFVIIILLTIKVNKIWK